MQAASAIIRARLCPPERRVTLVSFVKGSPERALAVSKQRSISSSGCGSMRLRACICRKSCTDTSITKFMFCVSCAMRWFPREKRSSSESALPSKSTVRPVGVSPRAAHSMSASSWLLPEPVGPTRLTISPVRIVTFRFSAFPSLSVPPRISMLLIVSSTRREACSRSFSRSVRSRALSPRSAVSPPASCSRAFGRGSDRSSFSSP